MSTHEQRTGGVAALPAIMAMAQSYDLDSAAFVYTFKTVAMPKDSSDAEFVSCCLVAKEHGLNPLTKEIYFMRTKAGGIQPIVSVDGWIKKCNEHPQFDGMELEDDRDKDGNLIGMFCTIYRKDRSRPTKIREDLKDCMASGGAVWKTSPYRMMRNRTICQCARIAFGFAGIMEPDEFAAWQSHMKDVTPQAEQPQASPPDIPEPPTEAEIVDDPAPVDIPDDFPGDIPFDDDPIADVKGYLAKLQEEVDLCDSEEELAEVRANNESMIQRIKNKRDRAKAEAIVACP